MSCTYVLFISLGLHNQMDFQLLPEMLQDDWAAANLCISLNGNMKNAAGLPSTTANASQFCTSTQKHGNAVSHIWTLTQAPKTEPQHKEKTSYNHWFVGRRRKNNRDIACQEMTNFPIVLPHRNCRDVSFLFFFHFKTTTAKQKITATTSYPSSLIRKYLLSGFKTSQLGVNEL